MKIRISELFAEPEYFFEISFTVIQRLEKILNEIVPKQTPKSAGVISLIVSTKSECLKAEAKGPSYDRKNKWITWGLWLPYKEVVQSPDQVEAFLTEFFKAAQNVLPKYGISLVDIKRAENTAKTEMVGNQRYVYGNDETPPLDLSKIRL